MFREELNLFITKLFSLNQIAMLIAVLYISW